MMGNISRNPIALAILAIGLLILIGSTFSIVPETRQAVIVRFGEPVRIVNRFKTNEDFGNTGAGLIARIPLPNRLSGSTSGC
jgi:membrane protease subunit HflC